MSDLKIGDWIETDDLNPNFRFCQVTGFTNIGETPVVYAQSPYYCGIRGNTYYFLPCVKKIENVKEMEQRALLVMLES